MEKKEARIKCSGCGTSYKVKVPVTDKPVSFKCKKCGKVLKLKIKPTMPLETTPQPSAAPAVTQMPELETTQLPDMGSFQDAPLPPKLQRASVVEHLFLDHPEDAPVAAQAEKSRSWIVLADDVIKGPLTDQDIMTMIESGEVTADTSLRLGERPWIKASEIPDFRSFFPGRHQGTKAGAFASMSMLEREGLGAIEGEGATGLPFFAEFPALISYPLAGGKGTSLLIFAGIAFLFATVLSLDFLLGLPLNLLGWILLYGYLANLMRTSTESPHSPPPAWDFSRVKDLAYSGLNVMVLVCVYSLIPVGICLLFMIFFFLNSMPALGYTFFALTILIYVGSLYVLPGSLAALGATGKLGSALKPSNIRNIMGNGGRPYLMLAAVSIAAGLACMLAAVAAVFLVDATDVGFVAAGLFMALVLSYGHFVWFHVLGRFAAENPMLMKQVASEPAT
ncbi:MAG: DUF4013 domain-containing protein [Desulfomonile tiedjei]|nr:DUF4013 domain-containing protein [Desulfomonile tiedjei]